MTDPIDSCGACTVTDTPTPEFIHNRPGLSQIQYRVGTYGSFRQAMLRAIHAQPALKASWTVRRDDDFGIALFALWAYILDILTFYQERIANEAFLKTAMQPESLRRLIALLDYTPSPGKAAAVYLAFLLQPPTPALPETTLPPRLRVQSVPGPNEQPQKFETEESRLARAIWNQLTPVRFQPQTLTTSTTRLYLKGRQTSIRPGDMLLIVGDERLSAPNNENWDVRPITEIVLHPTQTEVRWKETLGTPHVLPAANHPKAYILRRRASLFGFNAPLQPQTFTVTNTYTYDTSTPSKITGTTGVVTANPATQQDWEFNRPENGQPVIYLDSEYPKLIPDEWLILHLAGTYTELYQVEQVSAVHYAAYSLNGKVTRAKLDSDTHLNIFYANHAARKTEVLFGGQPFEIDVMPVTDSLLHGQTITVEGQHPDLEPGRPLLIKGPIEGADEIKGELAFIAARSVIGNQTTLTLRNPLTQSYPLATVEIYANVLYATHGETTTEVLGSGDAAQPFQSFPLKKAPVTYVPQAGAASTLQVRVNDVLWQEVANFYGHAPVEAIYTSSVSEGKRVVHGGDGQTGQRFPTGKNNITASYRVGIGEVGNVKAGVLTTLLDRPAGVKQVLNPLAAAGGADPEPPDQVRANAPNTVRTFGRIVSLRDFEDSARQYAGIAKARAEQVWNGEEQLVRLTVARDHGEPLASGGTLSNELLNDLNSRRDPNRSLELQDYTKRPIILQAKLYIDASKYLPDVVYATALKAIIGLFAFDNLNLGQTVYLHQVMATLQHVPGVVAVDVDRFIFKDDTPVEGSDVLDAAPAAASQLITLENPTTDLSLTPINGIKVTQL